MLGLGGNELIVLLLVVMILFGGSKVPELMRGLGQGMREFKRAVRDDDDRPLPPSETGHRQS